MQLILKNITGTYDNQVILLTPLPRKGNIWHIVFVCVGEVLLKQWKQGYT